MANADLYQGFSREKQAGYEAWLIERYGEAMRERLEHSREAYVRMSAAEREALAREYAAVEQALADAMRAGVDPATDAVDALIRRHRAWVSVMWGRPCPAERYAGLADLYLAHPDFVALYKGIAPGFADYLTRAMKLHASRGAATGD